MQVLSRDTAHELSGSKLQAKIDQVRIDGAYSFSLHS